MIERLAILADDLTGAADTGAAFAAAGRPTLVLLSPDASTTLPPADVLVLTSESRALPPDEAAEATRRCATRIGAWCQGDASVPVYKKIDSTLRGHPATELEVLMEALGERAALVAPAFPAQGRTTVGGRQCVSGVPLEDTVFGVDGGTSDLAALFGACARGGLARLSHDDRQRGLEHLTGRLTKERDRLWIADAEDDADLGLLAAAVIASPLRVLCGSAGLARALAARGMGTPGVARGTMPEGRRPRDEGRGPVLVVAGSRHPATAAQVEALRRHGAFIVQPALSCLAGDDPPQMAQTVARLVDALATETSVVLSTTALPEVEVDPVDVAVRLAAVVAEACDRVRVGGLVLTGGDVASSVCRALGSVSLWLTGELQPGIATATLKGGRHPDLLIVTKAGGFGDQGALRQAVAWLGSPGREG